MSLKTSYGLLSNIFQSIHFLRLEWEVVKQEIIHMLDCVKYG